MTKAKVYASMWDALADTPEQTANLRARGKTVDGLAPMVALWIAGTSSYGPRNVKVIRG